jgi:glycerophosphoryl diester phosphodiesterase
VLLLAAAAAVAVVAPARAQDASSTQDAVGIVYHDANENRRLDEADERLDGVSPAVSRLSYPSTKQILTL